MKEKVIGKIKTKSLKMTSVSSQEEITLASVEYNVIGIGKLHNGIKVYITDQEYKKDVPLIIVEDLVEEYITL